MEWMSAGSDYLSDRAFSEGFMSPLSNFFKEKLTEFGKAGAKITGFFFCFCFFLYKGFVPEAQRCLTSHTPS